VGFDFIDGGGHLGGESSGEGVFVEHDGDGSAFAGDAAGFEGGEKEILLLGVVTGVGEGTEEFDAFSIGIDLEALALIGLVGEAFEDVDDAEDDLVFGFEDGRRHVFGGWVGHVGFLYRGVG
jgi:hypothetical protein